MLRRFQQINEICSVLLARTQCYYEWIDNVFFWSNIFNISRFHRATIVFFLWSISNKLRSCILTQISFFERMMVNVVIAICNLFFLTLSTLFTQYTNSNMFNYVWRKTWANFCIYLIYIYFIFKNENDPSIILSVCLFLAYIYDDLNNVFISLTFYWLCDNIIV